jgi:pimeloyl-ACP methyl ester carboxylesterase
VTGAGLQPFRIAVHQRELDDLSDRLDRARFTPDLPGHDVGVAVGRIRELAEWWRTRYDWRRWEGELNRYPQHLGRVDGVNLHHLHVRTPEPDAFPLLLIHGWPMSVAEWLDVIEPLTERSPGFDLVIPSIPGFGFSGVPAVAGWDRSRIARAFAGLMRLHGYDRYGVHGNDVGASIALELGRVDPQHVAGVHVTQVFAMPSGDPAELATLSDEDHDRLERSLRFVRSRGAYLQLQATQPQTLAHALADSPLGQLAWSLQLLDGVSDDYLLTNVVITWLTRTAGSSALTGYLEPARAAAPAGPTTVPVGVTTFDGDVFQSVRTLAARDHANIVSWNQRPGGSHHPAHHVPIALADDLAEFFALVS